MINTKSYLNKMNWLSIKILVLCFLLNISYCSQDINTNNLSKEQTSGKHTTNQITVYSNKTSSVKRESPKLVCPSKRTPPLFWVVRCKSTKDCTHIGNHFICCNKICIKGVPPPIPEPSHAPMFGIIDRICPIYPMPEPFNIQECKTDIDCGLRICCPERNTRISTGKNYCRSGAPKLTRMPVIRQYLLPLKEYSSYLQCTPAPPPILDVLPKPCKSSLDCFPSLCCQENGRKICRPPRKSMLSLMLTVAQRISTSSITNAITQRIS